MGLEPRDHGVRNDLLVSDALARDARLMRMLTEYNLVIDCIVI